MSDDIQVSEETSPETLLTLPITKEEAEVVQESEGDGNTEAKAEEPKVDEAEKPKDEVKTIEYKDFKLPEGFEIKDEVMTKLTGILEESKMPKELAQKMLDLHVETVQNYTKQQDELFSKTMNSWADETKKDKEIGGVNFEQSIKAAQIGLKQFASPELVNVLKSTGLGNHIEVVRLFKNLGKLTREDNPVLNGSPKAAVKSTEEILYPNMFNKGD